MPRRGLQKKRVRSCRSNFSRKSMEVELNHGVLEILTLSQGIPPVHWMQLTNDENRYKLKEEIRARIFDTEAKELLRAKLIEKAIDGKIKDIKKLPRSIRQYAETNDQD
eukprot:364217-Hanusia_phi.AAC.4